MIQPGTSCDIFCRVVDNFGDIGVSWRLARQLAFEYRIVVRLIVDNLASFRRIEPAIDVSLGSQEICGVAVIRWDHAVDLKVAALVIETFAVNIPTPYVANMAARTPPPVWINLEYLSAEPWIGTHHLLPSPHPALPLTKYFFFPGFTENTGGLIRENSLLAERDAFAKPAHEKDLQIFLFSYKNAARDELLRAMSELDKAVHCSIPDSSTTTDCVLDVKRESTASRDASIKTLPFTSQQLFDRLLWRHDVLFVRGEDSFVRAQWAAKPFIWQIYPQCEGAHWVKLNAFLDMYCAGLGSESAAALRELWRAWNAEDSARIGVAWHRFTEHLPTFQAYAEVWSSKLAQIPDLAANLLSFYQKNTKIQGFAGAG